MVQGAVYECKVGEHFLVSLGLSFCWYSMLCRWFGSSGTFSISPKDHAELLWEFCYTIRSLKFILSKTQLIRFSPFPSSCCSPCFYYCGQQLAFLDTVSHLGHLLHHNLSDVHDINFKLRDMVRNVICLFATFPRSWFVYFNSFISVLLPFSLWLWSLVTLVPCFTKYWSYL